MSETIGHNTLTDKDQLRAIIERIEVMETEIKTLQSDRNDIYAEAKGNGWDVKALREIIKRRTWERDKMDEHDAIVETYMAALGMLADLPLGKAALERATTIVSHETVATAK